MLLDHILYMTLVILGRTQISLSDEKGSCAFAIDVTMSMWDDIEQVKKSVDEINQIVFGYKGSQVKNLVLVTFNDYYAFLDAHTDDGENFKTAVNKLHLHNDGPNTDYPERSLNGTLLAIRTSLPRSFIYVFTDAPAKDYNLKDEVIELCKKKQSQITFVVTDDSWEYERPDIMAYYDISAACPGFAMYVTKSDLSEIFEPIKDTLKDKKEMIMSRSVAPRITEDIPFEITEDIEYATVTASGYSVTLSVKGPSHHQARVAWVTSLKVLRLSNLTPGTYTATVWSTSLTRINVFGRTDFSFEYGFSAIVPRTIEDAMPDPIERLPTRLFISVTDLKRTVNILSIKFLNMDENIIPNYDLPLSRISNDFYSTPPFIPPTEAFKIAVYGKGMRTGQKIRRLGRFPVNPIVITNQVLPKISGETSMIVTTHKPANIKCMIRSGVPEPQISWQFKRKGESQFEQIGGTNNMFHISEVSERDGGSYKCIAGNIVGISEHITDLIVHDPPIITSDTSTVYSSIEGIDIIMKIPCKATGIPKPTITWTMKQDTIYPNAKYSFKDGDLVISNPTVDDTSTYVCTARNDVGSVSASIQAEILQKPQIYGDDSQTVRVGTSTTVKCTIVKGVPEPTITWQFMPQNMTKFKELRVTDNVHRILEVKETDMGQYKCIARNDVGDTVHITQLIVQDPPIITSDTSTVYSSIEGIDMIMKIPCKATGIPKPTITWTMKQDTIYPTAKYSFEDGDLVISKPSVDDTSAYVCTAKNDVGSVSASIQAEIRQKPQLYGDDSQTVRVGTSTTVKCRIVKGVPKPTITWQFMPQNMKKFKELRVTDNFHRILEVKETDMGQYKCIARNDVGDAEHITQLIVQDTPVIRSDNSITYKSIEQKNKILKIPCTATGLPKPMIKWSGRDGIISPSAKFTFENGDLIIHDPTVGDTGSYVCEAKNEIGRVNASFNAEVHQIPQLSGETLKKVIEGISTSIKCTVVKGVPSPTIRWYFMAKNKSTFVHLGGTGYEYPLPMVAEKDSGSYMCVANNNAGEDYHITVLVVQAPPVITSDASTIYEGIENEDLILRIPCKAIGLPKPTITWTVRSKIISPSAKYSFQDETLIIRSPTVDDTGTYICNARNEVGTVTAAFQAKIYQKPLIYGDPLKTVTNGTSTDIKCMTVEVIPTPTVTWQFMPENESKYVQLAGTKSEFHISNVTEKNAGRYKCIATNSVGDDMHVTVLVVQVRPVITQGYSKEYTMVEGKGKTLKIPCTATGVPKPTIRWMTAHGNISPDSKYDIEDGGLVIKDPTLKDTATYFCIATNNVGYGYGIFHAKIYQSPQISGDVIKTVVVGTYTNIKCKIVKGFPQPTVTWYKAKFGSKKYEHIPVTTNPLIISPVTEEDAGLYKCVAHNFVDDAIHITKLIVKSPLKITNKNTGPYKGLKGDVALRIPCDVVGTPPPSFLWSVNGTIITSDSHYSISGGALIIKDPMIVDTGSYKCVATNAEDSVSAVFNAEVKEVLDDYGDIEIVKVNVLDQPLPTLVCGSPGQSVRWFLDAADMNMTGNYLDLNNIDSNGNYSCRVSDMQGAYTKTYRVEFGRPPTFQFQQQISTFDWTGSDDDINDMLDCSVESENDTQITWLYNSEVMMLSDDTFLLNVGKRWGNYSCIASNDFGSVERSFYVISSRCVLHATPKQYKHMPLILNVQGTWPTFDCNEKYFQLNSNEKIMFVCPNNGNKKNYINILPRYKEITAICDKQDTLKVNGKSYKASDLGCKHDVIPTIVEDRHDCAQGSSKKIKVGFSTSGFLETYEVCFDISLNMPFYSAVKTPHVNRVVDLNYKWYKHPALNFITDDRVYNCKDSTSSCCYKKTQLVTAMDVAIGPAQSSTFIDVINAVPLWQPCNKTQSPWKDVEEKISSHLIWNQVSVLWSGIHTLEYNGVHSIPRYLFKLLEFINDDPIAIVYINGLSPTNGDVLCKNICADLFWMDGVDSDTIFCCHGDDFREKFYFYHHL